MEERNRQGAKKQRRGGRFHRKYGKEPIDDERRAILTDEIEKMKRELDGYEKLRRQGKMTSLEDLTMVADLRRTYEERREEALHLLQRRSYRRSPR